MIEIKMPKEVREYQEKWFIGMTKRQLAGSFTAIVINVPIYLYLKECIGSELTGWLIIITSAPFIMFGFYKPNGIPFEKMLLDIYRFYTTPQKRAYTTENLYTLIKEMYEKEDGANEESKRKKDKSKEQKKRKK